MTSEVARAASTSFWTPGGLSTSKAHVPDARGIVLENPPHTTMVETAPLFSETVALFCVTRQLIRLATSVIGDLDEVSIGPTEKNRDVDIVLS